MIRASEALARIVAAQLAALTLAVQNGVVRRGLPSDPLLID
ncbi:hypothetical protein [uncultured Agrobacterium sp.]|nr:hypothetical protein [uncultured Agrobacterium sp.]